MDNFKKTCHLDGLTPWPAIWSCETGQPIPCFDSCHNVDVHYQGTGSHTGLKVWNFTLVALWWKFLGWIDFHIFLHLGLHLQAWSTTEMMGYSLVNMCLFVRICWWILELVTKGFIHVLLILDSPEGSKENWRMYDARSISWQETCHERTSSWFV